MNDDLFATTLGKTHTWLNEIMSRLKWTDPHRALSTLRAVLHVLRDRLSVEEAAALGAQLPMLIRGSYYEGWKPSGKPERFRHLDEFYERVNAQLKGYDEVVDPEEATRVVLDVLTEHVAFGQAAHLRELLPKDLRQLIPAY